jgi:ATP-dependent Clp protease, protease subunit
MVIINISGEIGWDVIPDDIKQQLEAAKGKDIDVHIASPGGFVFDGIEIFNAIRDYKKQYPKAQMMATIKGLAASMASYLAVNPAFDLITAEDNAVFMIHNAWGGAVGDYREMKKSAEVLEGISDLLGQAYSKKTGKKKEEIKKAMDEESWYFGSEILESGFVDEIVKTPERKEKESAISESKIAMSILGDKLVKNKTDFTQLAAMLKPEPETVVEIEIKSEQLDLINQKMSEIKDIVNDCTNPALRDNITEVSIMSLKDLLAQNPAANIEYENALKESEKAGYQKGKADMIEISSKAAVFAQNAEYPAQVKAIALEVMQGKKSVEALDSIVATADMIKEMAASSAAAAEQSAGGTAQQEQAVSTDGNIHSMADLKAEAARLKGGIN